MVQFVKDPCHQNYHIKCDIILKIVSYLDEQSTKTERIEEELVFLIPQESTERDMFFDAWLPEMRKEYSELLMRAGHPIYGNFRGCLRKWHKDCDIPHIFVMSKGAEEDLKIRAKTTQDKFIEIDVLPSTADLENIDEKDFDLASRKKFYNDAKTV